MELVIETNTKVVSEYKTFLAREDARGMQQTINATDKGIPTVSLNGSNAKSLSDIDAMYFHLIALNVREKESIQVRKTKGVDMIFLMKQGKWHLNKILFLFIAFSQNEQLIARFICV